MERSEIRDIQETEYVPWERSTRVNSSEIVSIHASAAVHSTAYPKQ
jgi:hypothetical protein